MMAWGFDKEFIAKDAGITVASAAILYRDWETDRKSVV